MNKIYETTAAYVREKITIHPNAVQLVKFIEKIIELVREEGNCLLTEKDFLDWMCLEKMMNCEEDGYRPVKTSGDTFVHVKRPGLTRVRITLIRPMIQEKLLERLPELLSYAGRPEAQTEEWKAEAEKFRTSSQYGTI